MCMQSLANNVPTETQFRAMVAADFDAALWVEFSKANGSLAAYIFGNVDHSMPYEWVDMRHLNTRMRSDLALSALLDAGAVVFKPSQTPSRDVAVITGGKSAAPAAVSSGDAA